MIDLHKYLLFLLLLASSQLSSFFPPFSSIFVWFSLIFLRFVLQTINFTQRPKFLRHLSFFFTNFPFFVFIFPAISLNSYSVRNGWFTKNFSLKEFVTFKKISFSSEFSPIKSLLPSPKWLVYINILLFLLHYHHLNSFFLLFSIFWHFCFVFVTFSSYCFSNFALGFFSLKNSWSQSSI